MCLEGMCHLHLQVPWTLTMKATHSFETSWTTHLVTHHHILEDHNSCNKSCLLVIILILLITLLYFMLIIKVSRTFLVV
jgi:hypothetical protein